MISPKIFFRRSKFWSHILGAYIKKYSLWLISIFVLVALIIFIFIQLWPRISHKNVITIGYVGAHSIETIPAQILSLVTDSLVKIDQSGRPIPSLASHWTISDDGKTYIVFLKDNLKWHDGTTVDAKDLTIAISGVSVVALNNKAIEFKLPSPTTSFLLALNKPVFKTKSFYGTGAFRITDIDKVENTVKSLKLVPKNKKLPRVEIKFYSNETQALNALKIGEVKMATVANASVFENWPNLNVEKELIESEIVTLFFNNEDPLLSSKDLRQALNYAINRDSFDGLKADSPINPSSWAYNDHIKKYEYNPGKAKELLSKANVKNPTITLTVTPDFENIAFQIKKDWESIGVKTIVKKEEVVPKTFQALLAVNKLNPDPDQYALWHSTQKETNITNYKNVKVDKLLEDARATQNEEERRKLYLEFQETLVNDTPAVFLYHPYKYKVTYKNIESLLSRLPK